MNFSFSSRAFYSFEFCSGSSSGKRISSDFSETPGIHICIRKMTVIVILISAKVLKSCDNSGSFQVCFSRKEVSNEYTMSFVRFVFCCESKNVGR